MAADVLIVKNIEREGPGLLLPLLEEHGISSTIIEASSEECPSPERYKAMVVLGGPDSANDNTPKMKNELLRIREAIAFKKPYLGICLGMQALIAADHGAVVKAEDGFGGDQKEVGFIGPDDQNYWIELHPYNGRKDPLFDGLPDKLKVFQLHGETVKLKGAGQFILAAGKFCFIQAVRVGHNAYGIQSHFELTPDMLDRWATDDPDLQPIGQQTLSEQFAAIEPEYTQTGRKLFTNFLKIAGLVDKNWGEL